MLSTIPQMCDARVTLSARIAYLSIRNFVYGIIDE